MLLCITFIQYGRYWTWNILFAGSPWHVEVTDPKSISVSGRGLDFILVNRIENFVVNCGENMSKNINVSITGNHDDRIAHPVHTYLILSRFSFCRASCVYSSFVFSVFVLFYFSPLIVQRTTYTVIIMLLFYNFNVKIRNINLFNLHMLTGILYYWKKLYK